MVRGAESAILKLSACVIFCGSRVSHDVQDFCTHLPWTSMIWKQSHLLAGDVCFELPIARLVVCCSNISIDLPAVY